MANNGGNIKREQRRAPVYIPFKTLLTAVETLQQGLPGTLDRSVWPSFSGIVQSHTLGAFKFLGLVNDNSEVQPILERLVNSKGDDRKAVLREIIEKQYVEAISLGQKNAPYQQLVELFRGYGVQRGTLERAVRFFLDACAYTDLKCSPHWAKAKKTMRRQTKKEKEEGTPTGEKQKKQPSEDIKSNVKTIELKSGGTFNYSLSVDLTSLSVEDRTWLFEVIDKLNTYGQPKEIQK